MNPKANTSTESGWPKSNGMTVPEGYFEDFQRRMMDRIAAEPVKTEPKVLPRTFWQRVRPYVYMAAMFAGIWLMMNIFSLTSGVSRSVPTQSSPLLADLINSSTSGYVDDYLSVTDYDLYDDLYDSGYEIPEKL